MFKSFLNSIGVSSKIFVGISISPNIGIEMVKIDAETKTLLKYANKPLNYNFATRDIVSADEMIISIKELFAILDIPSKCNIILTIPNVFIGKTTLPVSLDNDSISSIVLSEVEQSYIFKDKVPVSGWVSLPKEDDAELKDILFTAIQLDFLEKIKKVCEKTDCTLSIIENSHASIMKALYFLDITAQVVDQNQNWSLMIANTNSLSYFRMHGISLLEYIEEPIPLSVEEEELYSIANNFLSGVISEKPTDNLFLVSETNSISVELLTMKSNFGSTIVKFIDCNKYSQTPIIKADLNVLTNFLNNITLSAIGTGIYLTSHFPIKFNLSEAGGETQNLESADAAPKNINLRFKDTEIELTEEAIKKVFLVSALLILIPVALIFLFITILTKNFNTELESLTQTEADLTQKIKIFEGLESKVEFNENKYIIAEIEINKQILSYYNSLEFNTPKNLWLNCFIATPKGVFIMGDSSSVGNIHKFYKGIKSSIINSNIRLNKLRVVSGSLDEIINNTSSSKYYEFEISNTTLEELLAVPAPATPPKEGEPAAPVYNPNLPLTKKILDKVNSSSTASPTAIPSSIQGASSGLPGLPPNLEKIEKF